MTAREQPKHIAMLVNPTSGRGQGARIAPRVAARLRAAGIEVVELITTSAEDVPPRTREAIKTLADAVVVVSGDGTIHQVVQEMAGGNMPLGVVPAGTGNDFARALGVPLDDPEAAADRIAAGTTRAIDLLKATDRFITTIVASGFDSLVNKRANAMRWPKGHSRYTVATFAELRTFKPLGYTVTLDGEVVETDAMLVAVGTVPSYGGGLRICEGAVIDDGLLDVTIIRPVSRMTLLALFPKLSKGTHVPHPQIEQLRGRTVRLESPGITAYADGEPLRPLPVDIEIAPAALTVLA
jgi:diacylglycerol kinase (ATP)